MDEQSIFHKALEKATGTDRTDWLDENCGPETPLRRRIDALLQRHHEAKSFLENPFLAGESETIGSHEGGNAAEAVNQRSVLRSLGQTLDGVSPVVLRDANEVHNDRIVQPTSPEIPNHDPGSRYQMLGELARGGMGAIIKGRDTDLGRDLAIKVLLDEHKDKPEIVQRFVEEAQIGGQLQHPGIAPLYELGQFSDRRPFFSMKLVKGETLSALLDKRLNPQGNRAKFLGIFEQICQTMAYAHSRGVIHRDLKPANVMVGAFGEVQVMDWGLAKVLSAGGVADEKKAHTKHKEASVIQTRRSLGSDMPGSQGSQTQMGSVMGTPAYMPPEQALGEIDQLHQPTDVFGLGAILCEILTGKPPYVGESGTHVFRLASRGNLKNCFGRLDNSGADAELIQMAKDCLHTEPGDRPRDAGVLATRLTDYLESVETKLRETEMARAAQSARAEEEQKRRRVTLTLSVFVIVALILGGSGWVYLEQQKADRVSTVTMQISRSLDESELHENMADGVDLQAEFGLKASLSKLEQAAECAKAAVNLADENPVNFALREKAKQRLAYLRKRTESARRTSDQASADRKFLTQLENIRLSQAGADGDSPVSTNDPGNRIGSSFGASRYRSFDIGTAAYLYEQAFRHAGFDMANLDITQAASLVRNSAIREGLISALDNWARTLPESRSSVTAFQPAATENGPGIRRTKLLDIATAADTSPWRKQVRAALADGETEALVALAAEDHLRDSSPAMIAWLGSALRKARAPAESADVLHRAYQLYPGDFWLNFELCQSLIEMEGLQNEGLGYARAALAIRPHSIGASINLANTLNSLKRHNEADSIFRQAIEDNPDDAGVHISLGHALRKQGKVDEAIGEYRKSIEVEPGSAQGYEILGHVLMEDKRELDESILNLRRAIELDARNAYSLINLGNALSGIGKQTEAIVEYRKAIEIHPNSANAHANLGNALNAIGKWDEAIVEFHRAIQIHPDYAYAHARLGASLTQKGKWDEAIVEFRRAIEIEPKIAYPHTKLGYSLHRQGQWEEAIIEFRQGIEFHSGNAGNAFVFFDFANALFDRNEIDEAIVQFRRAIEADPEHASAHSKLGYVLARHGVIDEAIKELRKAIEIAPDQPAFYNNLAWVLVSIPDQQGNYPLVEEGLKLAQKACELRPGNHYNFNTLGVACYRNKLWSRALTALRRSSMLAPQSKGVYPVNLLFQAMALQKTGNAAEARKCYTEALNLYKDKTPDKESDRFFDEAAKLFGAETDETNDTTPDDVATARDNFPPSWIPPHSRIRLAVVRSLLNHTSMFERGSGDVPDPCTFFAC